MRLPDDVETLLLQRERLAAIRQLHGHYGLSWPQAIRWVAVQSSLWRHWRRRIPLTRGQLAGLCGFCIIGALLGHLLEQLLI